MSFRYIYIQRAGFELSYVVQWDCNFFPDDGFQGLLQLIVFLKIRLSLLEIQSWAFIISNFNANCSWWFAGNLVWGWISMASSPQLDEMLIVDQEILNEDVDTTRANSNIPSPVSIAQETGMNQLPSSGNSFSQRSNQSTETDRLQFIYNKCVCNFLFL